MHYKIISFDLQGTISDSSFSDAFWLDLLPELYSQKHCVPLSDAKERLKSESKTFGRYDRRYYDFEHWLKELDAPLSWEERLKRITFTKNFYQGMEELIENASKKFPLLLFSATSHDFINYELGHLKQRFRWIFSALDDLQCAGKPPRAFSEIAKRIGVDPSNILHIGDDVVMDIKNSQEAGWNAYHFNAGRVLELCRLLNI